MENYKPTFVSVHSGHAYTTAGGVRSVQVGTPTGENRGAIKIIGLEPFLFRNVAKYDKDSQYVAPVKKVYTMTLGASDSITNISFKMQWTGVNPLLISDQQDKMFVSVIVTATETLTRAQLAARIVALFVDNPLWVATVSTNDVLFTERNFGQLYAELFKDGAPSAYALTVTTPQVYQQSYLGADLQIQLDKWKGDGVQTTLIGSLVSTAMYTTFHMVIFRRSISSPFNYSDNKPEHWLYIVQESDVQTSHDLIVAKMNALFALRSTTFVAGVPGTAQNTGDTITPTTAADVPANDTQITFLVAPTGLVAGTNYFTVGATGTTFQASLTSGGAAVAVTADTTGVEWVLTADVNWAGDATANDVFAL
jgi:hypothetical protein